MIQKLKILIASLAMVLSFSTTLMLPSSALAVDITCPGNPSSPDNANCGNLQCGSNLDVTCTNKDTTGAGDQVNTFVGRALNLLSIVVGVAAVIMIIVGGFRYVASGGKSESVSGAKNMIMYALIGLVIVALAQIIVRFVLNKTVQT
ncbi:MAG TPA: pilin [Candidatus Saccharimonadales bacterium]|nr:pilin [Candidatus Saccharimonadales bacterium]